MNEKKMIVVAGLVILVLIILNVAVRKKDSGKSNDGGTIIKGGITHSGGGREGGEKWYFNRSYVIEKKYEFKLKDIQAFYEGADFGDGSVRNYFVDRVINSYTLTFLKFMDERFNDSKDLANHLERASQYLYSVLPSRQASEMLELYKTYLNHLIDLEGKVRKLGLPSDVDEAIADLQDLQEYRRGIFGKEIADALFGAGVKAAEYPLRRSAIMADKDLFGAEKEYRLKQLDRDMWGDEADSVGDNVLPYTRYQEKLQIYQRDLSDMRSEEAKQARIQEFRREIFTPDQVRRLDEVDRNIANEKKKEENYFAGESAIKNNSGLSEEEKEKRIRSLQDETFGGKADAFRRGQAIKAGMEQFLTGQSKR